MTLRVCLLTSNDLCVCVCVCVCVVCVFRAPVLPLECFHGNGYSETVEVVRGEDEKIDGLYLKFLMEGELYI